MASMIPESIAIVGMSCRFPGGANDPEKYWELLAEGRDAWSKVPSTRWNEEAFYHPDPGMNGATSHRGGYFLDQDLSAFDPSFFGISGEEAKAMDPQQRVQLEITYEALENAGIPIEKLPGSKTAVYIALFSRDYDRIGYKDIGAMSKYHMVGTGDAILSNRISYAFDLRGPSMTIDTGCSGSLVGLHQACQSLRLGESNLALVGASNLILSPDQLIPMSLARFLSDKGHCYSFDSRGDGYGRGEGVAMVVLKRLSDALAAGDNIRAIVRNTGINQDGKTPTGITAPSADAQADLIRQVYAEARLDPRDTTYLEAHGTGTKVGDMAEFESTRDTFRCKDRERSLILGSVKSSIGHLESASGIAGLIKTVLMFERGFVVPNLHYRSPKPDIDYDANNMRIPTKLQSLTSITDGVHRASINGFGYGGANGHVILDSSASLGLQQRSSSRRKNLDGKHSHVNGITKGTANGTSYNKRPTNGSSHSDQANSFGHLITFTAKSEASLRQMLKNFGAWADGREITQEDLVNLSYTLCARRSIFPWRSSVLVQDSDELRQALGGNDMAITKSSSNPRVTFVFTGQGAQWTGMGRELLQVESEFGNSLRKSDSILRELGAEYCLIEELEMEEPESRLNESWLAQPASTALQIALVDLLRQLGVKPTMVLGHSSGEIAGAYAVGALSHHSALKASYERSALAAISRKVLGKKGAMMAVGLGEEDTLSYMAGLEPGSATIACVNSPSSVTVSGDDSAIRALKELLDAKSVFARQLKVDTAYHSHHMQEIADVYFQAMGELESKDAKVPFVSSVTMKAKTTGFGAAYWVQNLVSPVRFSDALAEASRSGATTNSTTTYIEIGPHSALLGPIRQTLAAAAASGTAFKYVPTLLRNKNAVGSILESAGKLFDGGHGVDLRSVHGLGGYEGKRLLLNDLPTYSWDRSNHYWRESRLSRDHRFRKHAYHDLLGVRVVDTAPTEPAWRHFISLDSHPWLSDHVIEKAMIFPGAGYLCMALEGLKQLAEEQGLHARMSRFIFRDVSFLKALIIPENKQRVEMIMSFASREATSEKDMLGWEDFRIRTVAPDGAWSDLCKGRIALELDELTGSGDFESQQQWVNRDQINLFNSVASSCSNSAVLNTHYSECEAAGNVYGPLFAMVEDLKIAGSSALAKVTAPDVASIMPYRHMSPHLIHPTTLDNIIQISLPLFYRVCTKGAAMPVYIEEIVLSAAQSSNLGSAHEVACVLNAAGQRSGFADFVAVQRGLQGQVLPTVMIKSQELRGLGDISASGDAEERPESMVSRMEWRPDISLGDFQKVIPIKNSEEVSTGTLSLARKDIRLEQVTALYMDTVVKDLAASQAPVTKPHLRQLLAWMKTYLESDNAQKLLKMADASTQDLLHDEDGELGIEGEATIRLGQLLSQVLTGETEPLSVLLQENMLYRLYADDATTICDNHLQTYLKHLTFKKPYLKVLEIGAGTGETSLSLLQAHSANSNLYFSRYDYTDISSGFFENAKTKFAQWADIMRFKTLNAEKDPVTQGFEEEAYDLIIASNVIHATSSVSTALKHVSKLLKPNGQFCLLEMTRLHPYCMLVYGVLPGWWAGSEDGRDAGPLLTTEQWSSRLAAVDLDLHYTIDDVTGPGHRSSLLISDKVPAITSQSLPRIRIIDDKQSDSLIPSLATSLLEQFAAKGLAASMCDWPTNAEVDDSIYVVLDVNRKPVIRSTLGQYRCASYLLTKATRMLWIAGGLDERAELEGARGLATGVVRTARSENDDLKAALLTLEPDSLSGPSNISSAAYDIISSVFADSEKGDKDVDYILRDGKLFIPRMLPEQRMNKLALVKSKPTMEVAPFHRDGLPLKLGIEKIGLLDTLSFFEDTDVVENGLKPDEVQIQVFACGVNFKDVFVALGQMKATTNMTGECAGVIAKVGSDVPSTVKVGDRVCALNATPYASMARVHYQNTAPIPESMPFTTAASIPIVFATAYEGLINVARLSAGQSVLIPSASGGVGQAAIQIARHVGANIFATVGSNAKRQLLIDQFHINPDHIFSSRSRRFKEGLMHLTQGQGVDVVLNSTSGEMLADMWSCLASFGTFVEIGKTDIYKKGNLNMGRFDDNVTFAAVDLSLMGKHKQPRVNVLLSQVMKMFAAGHLSPADPTTVMELGDIEKAFRLIQARKHTGKIVLDASLGVKVKTVREEKIAPLKLRAHGTYIITGGLGDLAGHMSRSMAKHGAGNIVLLSRRAIEAGREESLKNEFKSMGANLHIMRGDVTSRGSLTKVIDFCRANLPPIRGLIQGAMVLKDDMLVNMTMENFEAALKPKVDGTKNLLAALDGLKLDFFLCLSSLASIIGTSGQANYVAANTYMDYLAHICPNSDIPVVALNVGMLEDSNVIAGHQDIITNLLRMGYAPLKVQEFISFVEYLIKPENFGKTGKQIAIGANGASLSVNPIVGKHAMFRALRNEAEDQLATAANQGFKDIKDVILPGMDAQQVSEIIHNAVKGKIATLLAIKDEEIDDDCPIRELGMDSLITIELKNWVTGKFQANLVTSEIIDAGNLSALTGMVASRSELVKEKESREGKEAKGEEKATVQETKKPVVKHDEGKTLKQQEVKLQDMKLQETRRERFEQQDVQKYTGLTLSEVGLTDQGLPNMPLPELQATMDFFSNSVGHFCSTSEQVELQTEIDDFLHPGGAGQELQSRLVARMDDPTIEEWQNQLYVDYVYMRVRPPVYPFQAFSSWFLETRPRHTQAERAAIMTVTAAAFDKKLKMGLVKTDILNDEPLDMSTSRWIFGSVREPHTGVDVARKYECHDHIAVLRKGHVFKVMLKRDDGQNVGFGELKATFGDILSMPLDESESVAVLTGTDRNDWAMIRSDFISSSSPNASLLQTVESATFAVCLDDARPSTPTEAANHFLLQGSANRWSDKVTQLIICANSMSGATWEHSLVDGSSIGQLNVALGHCTIADLPKTYGSETPAPCTHLQFSLTPSITQSVQLAHKLALENAETFACETLSLALPSMGNTFFRKFGLSGKIGLQLLVQLASRFYFGTDQPPSYETVTMRSFKGGRVDIAQTLQAHVKEWCDAAAQEYGSYFTQAIASTMAGERGITDKQFAVSDAAVAAAAATGAAAGRIKAIFLAAAREHASNISRVSRGHGFAGHLYALQEMHAASASAGAGSGSSAATATSIGPGTEAAVDDTLPLLFRPGSTFWRTRPSRLMTDSGPRFEIKGEVENQAGYTMPVRDMVFVHYDARAEEGVVFVKAPRGQAGLVGAAVEAARRVVGDVLDS